MRFFYTKPFLIFLGCIVITSILVIFQIKGWLDPLRLAVLDAPRPIATVTRGVTVPLKNFFSTIYNLAKITRENSQLKQQVINLQQQVAQLNQQGIDNQALRSELGFVKNSSLSLVSCAVLSENAFSLSDAVILNCGSSDSVTVGEAVISQGYLVGKIVYAGRDTSTALLVTGSQFSTDAKISQNGTTAIVKGSYGSGMILDQVPQSSDLQKGWLIVTAGISSQIPKGILIGQVGDSLSSGNDLFKRSSLVSPIDFNNLDFVFVVKQ